MPLECVVVVEMVRPECPFELWKRWKGQREGERELSAGPKASQDPDALIRRWRGSPSSRDWDRLVVIKQRDGWGLLSHRREFIRHDEIEDKGDLT